MKYAYKSITPLVLATTLLALLFSGCGSYVERVQGEFDNPVRLSRLIARNGDVVKKINEGIPVFSKEDAKDYLDICGLSVYSPSNTQRRESAFRRLELSLSDSLNGNFKTICKPFSDEVVCDSYTLDKDRAEGKTTTKRSLVSFSASEKSGIYNASVKMENPFVEDALNLAIESNAYTPAEKVCKNRVLYERGKRKTLDAGKTILDGAKGIWNNYVVPGAKASAKFIGEKYQTTQDCLDAGHDAAYCSKALVGMQDKN